MHTYAFKNTILLKRLLKGFGANLYLNCLLIQTSFFDSKYFSTQKSYLLFSLLRCKPILLLSFLFKQPLSFSKHSLTCLHALKPDLSSSFLFRKLFFLYNHISFLMLILTFPYFHQLLSSILNIHAL